MANGITPKLFGVFAVTMFVGLLAGDYLNGFLGLSGSTEMSISVISFLIPAFIIFYIWKSYGEAAADSI